MINEKRKEFFLEYCDKIKQEIKNLIFEQGICAHGDPKKKKESCISAVFSAIINSWLGLEEIKEIIEIIRNRNAIDLDFFF